MLFNIVAFGRLAEFVEKYLHRGTKIVLEGEIHNNNYTNKDGQMIYGMQIIAQNIEFAESKASASNDQGNSLETPSKVGDGFIFQKEWKRNCHSIRLIVPTVGTERRLYVSI